MVEEEIVLEGASSSTGISVKGSDAKTLFKFFNLHSHFFTFLPINLIVVSSYLQVVLQTDFNLHEFFNFSFRGIDADLHQIHFVSACLQLSRRFLKVA